MNIQDISGPYAAIRLTQRLQPAGGPGSKLFPPTFEGGVYCFERRRFGDASVPCVLLDSVASAANRQEEVLLDLAERKRIELPRLVTDFSGVPELGDVSTLQAPHRVFDAILRDSEIDGKPFDKTPLYQSLAKSHPGNATILLAHAPNALLFGCWDSTGAAGGSGNKFARRLVTELIAVNVERGETRGGVRNDPLAISSKVEISIDKAGDWSPKGLVVEKGDRAKGSRPSEINHGNVLVKLEKTRISESLDGRVMDREHVLRGGVTCDHALQLSVISLSGLRRLRFPLDGKFDPQLDDAGRAVIAALGMVALTATRDEGYALRSRCDMVAEGPTEFERIRHDGEIERFPMNSSEAMSMYAAAIASARKLGLPWHADPIRLKPQAKLVKLIELSRLAGNAGD